MGCERKDFRFCVTPRPGTGERFHMALRLSQDEFEDYQGLRAKVHDAIQAKGFEHRDAVWHEAPPVDDALESALRVAIECRDDAQLIAYYGHSWHHKHYRTVDIGGVTYRYAKFSADHFIKYAPEVLVPAESM